MKITILINSRRRWGDHPEAWLKFCPQLVAELKFWGCHRTWKEGKHVDMPDKRHVGGHPSVKNTLVKIVGSGPNTWSEKVDWLLRWCMWRRNPYSVSPTLNFKIFLEFSYCKTPGPWWSALVSWAFPCLHILLSTCVWANSIIKRKSGFGQSERL